MPDVRSILASWLSRPTRQAEVAIDGLGPLRFGLHRRKGIWISDGIARGAGSVMGMVSRIDVEAVAFLTGNEQG